MLVVPTGSTKAADLLLEIAVVLIRAGAQFVPKLRSQTLEKVMSVTMLFPIFVALLETQYVQYPRRQLLEAPRELALAVDFETTLDALSNSIERIRPHRQFIVDLEAHAFADTLRLTRVGCGRAPRGVGGYKIKRLFRVEDADVKA